MKIILVLLFTAACLCYALSRKESQAKSARSTPITPVDEIESSSQFICRIIDEDRRERPARQTMTDQQYAVASAIIEGRVQQEARWAERRAALLQDTAEQNEKVRRISERMDTERRHKELMEAVAPRRQW